MAGLTLFVFSSLLMLSPRSLRQYCPQAFNFAWQRLSMMSRSNFFAFLRRRLNKKV